MNKRESGGHGDLSRVIIPNTDRPSPTHRSRWAGAGDRYLVAFVVTPLDVRRLTLFTSLMVSGRETLHSFAVLEEPPPRRRRKSTKVRTRDSSHESGHECGQHEPLRQNVTHFGDETTRYTVAHPCVQSAMILVPQDARPLQASGLGPKGPRIMGQRREGHTSTGLPWGMAEA